MSVSTHRFTVFAMMAPAVLCAQQPLASETTRPTASGANSLLELSVAQANANPHLGRSDFTIRITLKNITSSTIIVPSGDMNCDFGYAVADASGKAVERTQRGHRL